MSEQPNRALNSLPNSLPVHAIVVEYKSKEFTLQLLKDLLSEDPASITIVDNANNESDVDSVSEFEIADLITENINCEFTSRHMSDGALLPIRLLRSKLNLGFGAGVNSAVISDVNFPENTVAFQIRLDDKHAFVVPKESRDLPESKNEIQNCFKERYILVSNSDIRIRPGSLKRLTTLMDSHKEMSVVGPKLMNDDDTVYPSARRFPSFATAAGYAVFSVFRKNNRFSKKYKSFDSSNVIDENESLYSVDWVSGAFFLISSDTFQRLGGFDEGYFLYMEDVDLCYRVHAIGKKVGYATDCQVTHVGSVTISNIIKKVYYHHKSALRFERKTAKGLRKLMLPLAFILLALRGVMTVALAQTKSLAKKPKI